MKMSGPPDMSGNEDCPKQRLRVTIKPLRAKSLRLSSDRNMNSVSLTRQHDDAKTSPQIDDMVPVKRVRLSLPTPDGASIAATSRPTDDVEMLRAGDDVGDSPSGNRRRDDKTLPQPASNSSALSGTDSFCQLATTVTSIASGDEAVAVASDGQLASLIAKLKREISHISSNLTKTENGSCRGRQQHSSDSAIDGHIDGVTATSEKAANANSSNETRHAPIRSGVRPDYCDSTSAKDDVDSKLLFASAFSTEEMNSVFTSDSLDEYLRSQNDKTRDADDADKLAARRHDDVDIETVGDVTFFSFHSLKALKRHLRHVEHDDVTNSVQRRVTSGLRKKTSDWLVAPSSLNSDKPPSVVVLDRIDCLVQDGLIRCLEPNVVSGLVLEGGDQFAKYALQNRVVRSTSEDDDQERQPRKGKIYGRKYGRFASKACIDYHVKKRTPVRKRRVKLNNSRKRTGDQFSLVQVSAWQAQQAIMALQLAPSMNNSPIKCRKIGCQPTCICKPIGLDPAQIKYDDDTSPSLPLPNKVTGVTCQEAFCRLGCVCDSIRGCSKSAQKMRRHCGSVDCMLECTCTSRKARLRSGRMTLYDGHVPIISGSKLTTEDEVGRKSLDDFGGGVRKSGRIRYQPDFSSYSKMNSLIYYDPALWLQDDAPSRKKKGKRTSEVGPDKIMLKSREESQFMASSGMRSRTTNPAITIKEEDVEVVDYSSSSEVFEITSCARTSVYTPKRKSWSKSRTKHRQSLIYSEPSGSAADSLKDVGVRSSSEQQQSNVSGFRTNSFLIQNNGKKNAEQNVNPKVFVLEVQSDCSFEPKLDAIVRLISSKREGETSYPPLGIYHCCGFRIEILPRSLKPVHVPYKPECDLKVQSLYSVRIRVTKVQSNLPNAMTSSPSVGPSKLGGASFESASLSGFNQLKMVKSGESGFASSANHQPFYETQPLTTKCKFGPFNQEDKISAPMPTSSRLKPSILCSSKLVSSSKTPQTQSAVPFSNVLGQPVNRLTLSGSNPHSTGPSMGLGVRSTSQSVVCSSRSGRWVNNTNLSLGSAATDSIDCTVISDVESSDKETFCSSIVLSSDLKTQSVSNGASGRPSPVSSGLVDSVVKLNTSSLGIRCKLPVLRPRAVPNQVHTGSSFMQGGSSTAPNSSRSNHPVILRFTNGKQHLVSRETFNGLMEKMGKLEKAKALLQQQQPINPIVIEPCGDEGDVEQGGIADAEVANEASSFKGSAASSVVNTSPMDQLRPAAIPSTSSQTVQDVVEVIDSDVDPIISDSETTKSIDPSASGITMGSSLTSDNPELNQTVSGETFAVKSKRKQLIALRNPAMEFTEELILITNNDNKSSVSCDQSQAEAESVDAVKNEARAKSLQHSQLVAYIRQLSIVLSDHGFLSDHGDVNKTTKRAIIETAAKAARSLTQKKLSLREEFLREKKLNEDLRRRLQLSTGLQNDEDCSLSSSSQDVCGVENSDSQVTSKMIADKIVNDCFENKSSELELNSTSTHEDSRHDSAKSEQLKPVKTEPSSDSNEGQIKVSSSDEVEEKKVVVRQQVDTGKLVVSGNLLKLLSKTSLRIPVPRPATSKGPINDSAAGN